MSTEIRTSKIYGLSRLIHGTAKRKIPEILDEQSQIFDPPDARIKEHLHNALIANLRSKECSSLKSALAESDLIESLSRFMRKLNYEDGALVVVEGIRDARALKDSGYGGKIFMLCHNTNIAKLEDKASAYKKTILLLDNDSEGRKLAARTQRILRGRVKLDMYYQRELLPASRGKIRHIEELSAYADRLARHV